METAEYQRQWRLSHKEHLREYFRRYDLNRRSEKRIYNRKRYAENAEVVLAQKRLYYLANREKIAAKRKLVPKEQRAAQRAVQVAVQTGKLIRALSCQTCSVHCKTDAHHHKGYARAFWLDVIWVCRKCHFRIHHP